MTFTETQSEMYLDSDNQVAAEKADEPTPEEFYGIQERKGTTARHKPRSRPIRLTWQVGDFSDVTESIYEAVMIAAKRARQIGRRQKAEIDAYNATQEAIEPQKEGEEEAEEKGIDHFRHPKPTIKALDELKTKQFRFYYPDEEEK